MSSPRGPEPRPGDLDPLEEPDHWEALVGAIGARAAPRLAARREPAGVLDVVVGWARPALAAAASLVLMAPAAAMAYERPGTEEASAELVLARAVMPSTFAGWITGTAEPTVADLARSLDALDEEER